MCVTQCRRENVKEMGRGRDRCRDMAKVEFQGLVRQIKDDRGVNCQRSEYFNSINQKRLQVNMCEVV